MIDDDEQKQAFDTLATAKQVMDSGAKLLALRDAQIKTLEAKVSEWRARAENAEIELEAARERVEAFDAMLDEHLDTMDPELYEAVVWEGFLDEHPKLSLLHDIDAVDRIGDSFVWSRWSVELRRRAKQRREKR